MRGHEKPATISSDITIQRIIYSTEKFLCAILEIRELFLTVNLSQLIDIR